MEANGASTGIDVAAPTAWAPFEGPTLAPKAQNHSHCGTLRTLAAPDSISNILPSEIAIREQEEMNRIIPDSFVTTRQAAERLALAKYSGVPDRAVVRNLRELGLDVADGAGRLMMPFAKSGPRSTMEKSISS